MSERDKPIDILTFSKKFFEKNKELKGFIIYSLIVLILSIISFSYYIEDNNCFTYNDPRRIIGGGLFGILALIIITIGILYGMNEAFEEMNTESITTFPGSIVYVVSVLVQIGIYLVFTMIIFRAPLSLSTMNEDTFNIGHPNFKAISASLSLILMFISIRILNKNIDLP